MQKWNWMETIFSNKKQDGLGMKSGMILLLGLAGIFLLSFSSVLPQKEASAVQEGSEDQTAWVTAQEQKLESMIGQMEGAGSAKVMITLETDAETVYATDTRTDASTTQQSHVLVSGQSAGLVETVWMPQVQGVAVLCQGADSLAVQQKITEMVSVLMGVPTNRISIAKMN